MKSNIYGKSRSRDYDFGSLWWGAEQLICQIWNKWQKPNGPERANHPLLSVYGYGDRNEENDVANSPNFVIPMLVGSTWRGNTFNQNFRERLLIPIKPEEPEHLTDFSTQIEIGKITSNMLGCNEVTPNRWKKNVNDKERQKVIDFLRNNFEKNRTMYSSKNTYQHNTHGDYYQYMSGTCMYLENGLPGKDQPDKQPDTQDTENACSSFWVLGAWGVGRWLLTPISDKQDPHNEGEIKLVDIDMSPVVLKIWQTFVAPECWLEAMKGSQKTKKLSSEGMDLCSQLFKHLLVGSPLPKEVSSLIGTKKMSDDVDYLNKERENNKQLYESATLYIQALNSLPVLINQTEASTPFAKECKFACVIRNNNSTAILPNEITPRILLEYNSSAGEIRLRITKNEENTQDKEKIPVTVPPWILTDSSGTFLARIELDKEIFIPGLWDEEPRLALLDGERNLFSLEVLQ